MTRRDKLSPQKLQGEIEELFAELWQVPRFAGLRRHFRPNVDSFHTNDPHQLTVIVEVPGIDPGSLAIIVSERVLLISGDRTRERADGRVYQQMEIEYGPFQRQVRLVEDVDPDGARARYEHGIITISLPVASAPRPGQRHSIAVDRR